MTTLLALRGLSVRGGDGLLLERVDVTVDANRITALVGPSGVGKTLTARAALGVVDVLPGLVGGTLRFPEIDPRRDWYDGIAGRGAAGARELERRTRAIRGSYVTYAPQAASSALNPGRTIGRQLELAVRRRRSPSTTTMRALLERVGLDPGVAALLPGELSGGMCQRAALAVALAPEPRIVVADEPETGLDPVLRRGIVELMVESTRALGSGLVLISHHEDTVARIADHVVRFDGGAAPQREDTVTRVGIP
jgi:ABC-type glutathione transport system ATPase component